MRHGPGPGVAAPSGAPPGSAGESAPESVPGASREMGTRAS
jgi:hypothetical protein